MAIKVLVGLGNPGTQYQNHRHNIGFLFINNIIKLSTEPIRKKLSLNSHIYRPTINGQQIICIKPQTFMNESGTAVQRILNYYKYRPQEMCVIFDDFDLPLGNIRLRKLGSAGTHNGMKSIIQHLGTTEFPRLRLGIGPKPTHMEASNFVLQPFSKDELTLISNLLTNTTSLLETNINKTIDQLMNIINTPRDQ